MVSHLNPDGLHRNPAFSQVITTSGHTRTIYVGGQNAVDSSGTIIGKGDIGIQAKQVARNLQIALTSACAGIEHVVKWTVYVAQGQPLGPAMSAFQQVFGPLQTPPTLSVLFVAGLAHPDFLLEVEATAVVPDE
jgi:enamine deaminase RidA (YjgF/YER057c/UK114 family)